MEEQQISKKTGKPKLNYNYKNIKSNGKIDTGRPPIYKTKEQLQSKIDKYFAGGYRTKTIYIKQGKEVIPMQVPAVTITGLVLFLGFCDRKSFYDLEKDVEFCYTIKRARTFIEREYEEQLDKNPTGAIFALKNMNWSDKQEIEHSGDMNMGLVVLPNKKIANANNVETSS